MYIYIERERESCVYIYNWGYSIDNLRLLWFLPTLVSMDMTAVDRVGPWKLDEVWLMLRNLIVN